MSGEALLASYGHKANYGTDDYFEADRLKKELNQLGYAVRIVTFAKRGNRRSLGTYRVTWWPTK